MKTNPSTNFRRLLKNYLRRKGPRKLISCYEWSKDGKSVRLFYALRGNHGDWTKDELANL